MALGLSKLLTSTAGALDRRFGWDKLPRPLGVLTLVGLRMRLREKNLYDTGVGGVEAPPQRRRRTAPDLRRQLHRPGAAGDGQVGARFGRNVPVEGTTPRRCPS